jgi:CheY-like chemotaxis protein
VFKNRILIADDDLGMLYLLKKTLAPLSLDICYAQTAMAALTTVHQKDLDLVILDINMPGGNGLGACEMLASNPMFAQLPIIILTGRSDDGTQHRCQKLGARYVRKGPEAMERVGQLVCGLLSVGDWLAPGTAASQLFVG